MNARWRFILAHPLRARRFLRACRAPWFPPLEVES